VVSEGDQQGPPDSNGVENLIESSYSCNISQIKRIFLTNSLRECGLIALAIKDIE